jgi:hypothetical protein
VSEATSRAADVGKRVKAKVDPREIQARRKAMDEEERKDAE